jgi:hypothetical protein
MELTKCSVELYNWWQRGELLSHRLGVVLFHAWRGGPAEMGPTLTSLLVEAAQFLKRPQSQYWWNGCDVAAYLIARGLREPSTVGRFTPHLAIQPGSSYLWRIYLLPGVNSEITCHQLQFTKRNALDLLTPIDWRKAAARKQRR